ncbi:YdeI family protein [Aeromicrobium sp. Leaf350]|uniref:YdeI/OmpD-associated family protein n=1 Tax=Aeromicrobium sp. Leaf350 TaxID=2876565 RepID=UPI001E2E2052|nr:YdeI/OmpD-associated family protein [Aeromicrobium sp. Leaf350]
MSIHDDAVVHPSSAEEWGAWLAQNHASARGVWVRIDDRTGRDGRLSYEDSVCEALRWGWVDGQTRSGAELGSQIRFTPRRSRSAWAATNKARVARLEAEGRLQPPGVAVIAAAKANGMWSVLDGPEAGLEPAELTVALDAQPAARDFWDGLSVSARKYALTQIALARKDETRLARISKTVDQCAAGVRPDR